MVRLCIVCAACRNNWPLAGAPSPYLEMQLMSQPCPRCEAYTLSVLPVENVSEAASKDDEDVLPVR
jgi:hypothetical protein